MRHDVMELSSDPRALFHHRPCARAFRHRFVGRVEGFDRLPSFAQRLADDEGGGEEKQWSDVREALRLTVESRRCENEEEDEQRGGEEEAAPDHELDEQEEHDAEGHDAQRSATGQEHDGDQRRCDCGERRPPPCHEQARDSQHVQDDLDLESAAGDVVCEARLEGGRPDERDCQGHSPVAAREQMTRRHEPLRVQRVHVPIVVTLWPRCLAPADDLRAHPGE